MTAIPNLTIHDGQPVTTSLDVAEKFDKRHDLVLRAIRNMECSKEFSLRNFAESSYLSERKQPQPMYHITRDGFAFLAMGFTGKEAARWKEAYIAAFNRQEQLLKAMLVVGNGHAVARLFEEHPRWPVIRQLVLSGEPMAAILRATGLKRPSSVHRNINQLVHYGLLAKEWRGHPYAPPKPPFFYRLPIPQWEKPNQPGALP